MHMPEMQKAALICRPSRSAGTYYAIKVPGKDAAGKQPRQIGFMPIPGTTAPDDYTALQIDIERTLTVLNILFPSEGGHRLFRRQRPDYDEQRFSEYYDKLTELALTALGQDQVRLGRLALIGLQDEVVAREGARVKNTYIKRLGLWAFAFAVPAVVFYFICRYSQPDTILHRFREFISLLAGCLLGTWLSFSIRRQRLAFWDLARIEEDLLDPAVRLLFVTGLSIVVGLTFATRMVVFNIGGFNTAFLDSGTLAVLIGALCGIGEMGLPGALARRASEMISPIGTGAPPGAQPAPPPAAGGGPRAGAPGGGGASSSTVAGAAGTAGAPGATSPTVAGSTGPPRGPDRNDARAATGSTGSGTEQKPR
jgi:hypothetical protein